MEVRPLGLIVPGNTRSSNLGSDSLGPPDRKEPNLGLQRPTVPDMQFMGGDISPADFAHDASPHDTPADRQGAGRKTAASGTGPSISIAVQVAG
jgi:hypothetical protein